MMFLNLIGISDAFAAGSAAQAPMPGMGTFLPYMILIGALFYFMIFRPQSKQAKQQQQMLGDIAKGDEVLTSGGIIGKIVKLRDDFIVLHIADNVELKLKKSSISKVLPKGTFKSICQ